jgi:hypothetical protein
MMGLFGSKKKDFCTICKKEITHKSKPKKEWDVEGPLCANCYVDFMKKPVLKKKENEDKCVACGAEPGGLYLWKPKKEWGITGWLCEPCLKEREKSDDELKKNCILCNATLGFITRRPKKEWNIQGYLCKNCYTLKESQT